MSDSPLFRPFQLGPWPLPHRIVMAPMTRNRAGAGNTPTALMAEYYAQRASAALIVTEATQIVPEGVGYPNTPGIHSEAHVSGWRAVTDAVHGRGGRIFLQLWHVGRISHPALQPGGALPVAPSAIAPEGHAWTRDGSKPYVVPRALDTSEIPELVAAYAAAARRAREAGFDGVEIHGANGYLIDQFLADGVNRRTDAYGGSLENRVRFLYEVTEAVIRAWSADRVGVRLSPRGTFNSISDSNRAQTYGYAVRRLNELAPLYLHLFDPVSAASGADAGMSRLAPELRKAFSGPVIVNGGFDSLSASETLDRGEADLVAFGVPFLSNPDLPARLRRGALLNAPQKATFYGGGAPGYTDYPPLPEADISTVGT